MKCPCCHKDNFREKYSNILGEDEKIYKIIECKFCRFATLSPMPTEQDLTLFYTTGYSGRNTTNILEFDNPEDFLLTNKSVFEDMNARLLDIEIITNISNRGGRRLLDIGCGYGHGVYCANSRGYIAEGIDLNSESVTYGVKKLGLNLWIGSANNVKDKFDVVTQWMVLEHTLRPDEQVQAIYNCLNDKGVYAGSVPNIGGYYAKLKGRNWYNIVPPEHINYFNHSNLRIILERSGFDILFLGTISRYASPSINFGIRTKLNNIISKTKNVMFKKILLGFYRFLTIVKRIFVYRLLNFIIVKFKLGGNGIFWVVQKNVK